MKKYLWMSSGAVVIGALRVNCKFTTLQQQKHMCSSGKQIMKHTHSVYSILKKQPDT